MHERKTNTNLFWQVKFICFHLISATSIDKTTQLLMDNRLDSHFDNEYKFFAIKRFQLKLVKSFPSFQYHCVSTTGHGIILRFYRTELCKQGTSDNATTESDYIVFIYNKMAQFQQLRDTVIIILSPSASRGGSEDRHDPERWVHVPPMTANCKQRPFSCFKSQTSYKYMSIVDYKPLRT